MSKRLFVFFFFFLSIICFGQPPISDSVSSLSSADIAIQSYHQSMGTGSALYNGLVHTDYPPFSSGFAYYNSNEWQKGSLVYDNLQYNDILLKYDLVADQILIKSPQGFAVILFSPRVKDFTVSGHNFFYMPKTSRKIAEGFYDLLQSGAITILAKREKKINENVINTSVSYTIIETKKYYALKDGIYYTIKNINSILQITGGKKKEIQQFLKKNNIKFKRDGELALIKIAEYFNQHQ